MEALSRSLERKNGVFVRSVTFYPVSLQYIRGVRGFFMPRKVCSSTVVQPTEVCSEASKLVLPTGVCSESVRNVGVVYTKM